jgi:hypothetical protein
LAPPCHRDFLEKLKMTKIRGQEGLKLLFFGAVKGPFIITQPGMFGVTTATEGETPKK